MTTNTLKLDRLSTLLNRQSSIHDQQILVSYIITSFRAAAYEADPGVSNRVVSPTIVNTAVQEVLEAYNNPARYYHNFNHVLSMLRYVVSNYKGFVRWDYEAPVLTEDDVIVIAMAVLYHDIDMSSAVDSTNVQASIQKFKDVCKAILPDIYYKKKKKRYNPLVQRVLSMIGITNYSAKHTGFNLRNSIRKTELALFTQADLHEIARPSNRTVNNLLIIEEYVHLHKLPRLDVLVGRLNWILTTQRQLADQGCVTRSLEFYGAIDFKDDIACLMDAINNEYNLSK